MNIFVLAIVGFVVFKILYNLTGQSNQCQEDKQITTEIPNELSDFKLRKSLMTSNERIFFETLKKTYGSKYDIYPQVHLGAIFEPIEKWKNWGQLSKLNKRVDFLIYNRQFQTPVVGIELDDMSHSTNGKTIERDKFVEALFEDHHIPLVRFRNGRYDQEELTREIQPFLVKA